MLVSWTPQTGQLDCRNFAVYSFLSDTSVLASAFRKGKAKILLLISLAVPPFCFFFFFVLLFLSIAVLDETTKISKWTTNRHKSLQSSLLHIKKITCNKLQTMLEASYTSLPDKSSCYYWMSHLTVLSDETTEALRPENVFPHWGQPYSGQPHARQQYIWSRTCPTVSLNSSAPGQPLTLADI